MSLDGFGDLADLLGMLRNLLHSLLQLFHLFAAMVDFLSYLLHRSPSLQGILRGVVYLIPDVLGGWESSSINCAVSMELADRL